MTRAGVPTSRSPQTASTDGTRAVLDKYCVSCHNDRVRTAGISLSASSTRLTPENADLWEKVVTKLDHRHMPPMGMQRPDEATYRSVISTLETALDSQAEKKPDPGRTPALRRLNRMEYRNSIRDLLALDVDVSTLLPADESSHGFDNITVSGLSPTLLERYLSAAHKISRLAIGAPDSKPNGSTTFLPPDLTQENHLPGLPYGTRGGGAVPFTFPANGTYELQVRLTRDRDERVEGLNDVHQLEVALDGKRVGLFSLKPVARDQQYKSVDNDLNVRLPVTAGEHSVSAVFVKKTSALIETERQPYLAHFNADRHPRIQPAVYSLSVIGPYDATTTSDTPSRSRIFVCSPAQRSQEEACANRILSTLLRRAYRRPVNPSDLQAVMKFYREGRVDGGFEAGIEMALRALLVNPQFLFRIEKDPAGLPPNATRTVSDLELASRLSFFLWSSIPDDELLDLASRGKLKNPTVLEQQTRRMLKDPRAEALVTNFASQWLYLRNLTSASPDPRLFPDFDDNLRQAFRQETELFVESVVREDRNVVDLLQAKYTFLNERLAKHYGIPHIYGSRFRKVSFDENSERGGLLSQGSILTVTSYATRTSPVIRGKWILDNILGTPPNPPPPQVPQLKEAVTAGKFLSMRERVAQHRANPACAGCHNLMDPLGFALEKFDAVGRSRTEEGGEPVDASGNLPSGVKFDGPAQLKDALLQRPDLFVKTLTGKLLTYSLGRGVDSSDAPAIRKIVRDAQQNNYRFSSIILGIVSSQPFLMRRSS